MRKYLMGARVMSVEQEGIERAVTLTFGFPPVEESDLTPCPPSPEGKGERRRESSSPPLQGEGTGERSMPIRPGTRLIVELIPRFGNLILTNEAGVILDCEHRVAPGPDRVRTLAAAPAVPAATAGRARVPARRDRRPDRGRAGGSAARPGAPGADRGFRGSQSGACARGCSSRGRGRRTPARAASRAALIDLADLWRRRAWEPGVAEADGSDRRGRARTG